VVALFVFDHFILKAHVLTGYYNRPKQQLYYNHTTTTTSILQGQDDNTIQNDTATIQQPACPKMNKELAPQPLKKLSEVCASTLKARHPELQVEAERMRRARQEEEQADFSRGITHARSGDGGVVILVLDEVIAMSRSSHLFKILVNLTIFSAL
jgi:hypothetical protein